MPRRSTLLVRSLKADSARAHSRARLMLGDGRRSHRRYLNSRHSGTEGSQRRDPINPPPATAATRDTRPRLAEPVAPTHV